MNRKYNFAIPALLAGLLAACGGGSTTGSASSSTPSLLATSTVLPSSWTSVKWGAAATSLA